MNSPERGRKASPGSESGLDKFATNIPVVLDTAGILYVEALRRIHLGTKAVAKLQKDRQAHQRRLAKTAQSPSEDDWIDLIQGVGSLEPRFAAVAREFFTADVLLVAAAEAYINQIARHVLVPAEAEHFDKLSPVGKWLFLPRVMRLKWRATLSGGPVQHFTTVVLRRNRVVHPRTIKVTGIAAVERLVDVLALDPAAMRKDAECVKAMIRQFSLAWRRSYGPDWLEPVEARNRPPCCVIGPPEAPGRLGRLRRKNGGA